MDLTGYFNPTYITPMIALLALVLSQFPPIRELLKKERVRIGAPDRLSLSHSLGRLQLTTIIGITNTGGKDTSVSRIDCVLKAQDGSLVHLPGQTFSSDLGDKNGGNQTWQFGLGWIPLKIGENWTRIVQFYVPLSDSEEEESSSLIEETGSEISLKLSMRPEDDKRPVEINELLLSKLKTLFDRNFKLHRGSFRIYLAATSPRGQILDAKAFDGTIFESNVAALRRITEGYVYGSGVAYAPKQPWSFFKVHPVDEAIAIREYRSIRSTLGI